METLIKNKIAAISILVNAILAGGKIFIGLISHSVAISAEGLHSSMDVLSSTISYVGIKVSKKPSDQKHPYGHYKFEVLAGTLITLILLGTGLGIIYEAYQGFIKPEEVKIGYLAFLVMIFSAVVNEIMARLKIYFGKKENLISLLTDGFHSRVDVFISLAVLSGLFLVKYWIYADSLLALLIGLYIIKESFSLGKEAVDSLLDVSAGKEIEEKIKSITQSQKIQIFSLKTQKKGSIITVNLEIKLPSSLSVEKAANISDKLREGLMNKVGNLQYVTIQIRSHEMSSSFYQPVFGKGFGWQKQGRFKEVSEKATGKGPGGYCVCLKCGYKIIHQHATPCSTLKCPNCKTNLERQ